MFAGLAVVIVGVFAGLKSIAMLAVGLAALAAGLAAGYFFLSQRGVRRWLALAVFVAAPVAVIVAYAFAGLLWVAIVSAAAWLLAGMTARSALAGGQADWRMPERPAQPPAAHPYLIMNPKSGGGKVGKFDLKRKAEELGAEVFLMDGPEPVDVAEVARAAVANGADLLGVAGGDGTQALVAGVAAQHGIPFMVITAGTRNHFALDLGLDRQNPAACLAALSDGVELRVDLGVIGGQTFVNNASFGAYAEVVETPAYRGDKLNTTLDLLPDLLQGHRGARLSARADGAQITAPQALLVANNPYGTGDIAGLSRRARLDGGMLGVVGVTVSSARQAVGLLRGTHGAGLTRAGHEGDRDHRRRGPDPGRHRRRGGIVARPGAVHDPPRRAPRAGAPGPPGRDPAQAPDQLVTAATPRSAPEIASFTAVISPAVALPDERPSPTRRRMSLASSSYSYPLLAAFWTIFEIFLWVIWFWILITVFIDIFRSHDLSGWAKALWFLFVLFIPLIGVLVYLIARGGKMHERAARQARRQDEDFRAYVQQAAARTARRTSWPSSLTCATEGSSRPRSSTVRRPRSSPERARQPVPTAARRPRLESDEPLAIGKRSRLRAGWSPASGTERRDKRPPFAGAAPFKRRRIAPVAR